MGYKRKLYVLKWPDGHELAGLEVTTKGLTVDKLFELATLADQLTNAPSVKEQVGAARLLFGEFALRLVSWNLEEDDGTPVPAVLAQCRQSGKDVAPGAETCPDHAETEEPCSVAGIRDQDMTFMISVILTWMDEVASVDIPLPGASPDGATTETEPDGVASIPVETLSPSLLS